MTIARPARQPASVADPAADLDLPLGVVEVLLADLRARSLITVQHPTPPAKLADPEILTKVADGLRQLLPGRQRGPRSP